MNIGYIFLIIIASTAYFVSSVPTPEQMIADFDAAQKYYTSGAYDQAIETYEKVGSIESRFIDEESVIVAIGDQELRIKDATLYQMGNSYNKRATLELDDEAVASSEGETEQAAEHSRLAREYIEQATVYFNRVQEETDNDDLKVMSQNQIIDTWYLIDDLDRVIEEGQILIERYPASIYVQEALYNIGWAHYDAERYDDAIESFNELVTRFPTGNRADRSLFQVGESYFAQERYDEAIPSYQTLVDKMRINELTELEIQRIQRDKIAGLTDDTALDLAARAALRIGACYGNAGRYDEAEASYKRMAQLFTFDNNLIQAAYTSLADMYYDKGQFDDCIQAYRDAIDEVPDQVLGAKMQYMMAQRYFDGFTGEDGTTQTYYDEAITAYNNYISNYSEVALRAGYGLDLAFFNLGRAYYELGAEMMRNDEEEVALENLELAIGTYERIFEDFPATSHVERIEFYLGIAYQENGTEEYIRQAIVWYNRLLEEYPETMFKEYVYVKMARAYKSLEEYDTAIEYYTTMIDEFPESEQVDSIWFELGVTMTDMGDEIGAVDYLQRVSRDNAQLFTTARLLSAQTLLRDGRDQQVVEVIDYAVEDVSAIESEYRLSQLYLMRGNAHKNLEDNDSALADYSAAYDLNVPETQQMASVYRAGVYIELQQYARAERDLLELVESDDEDIKRMAQIRLAVISVNQNKSDQAIQTYLDLYNETEEVAEKLGYLRNLIQLSSQAERWDDLTRFANMMIDSEIAVDQRPEGQNFYFIEEAYYMLGDAAETRARALDDEGNEEDALRAYVDAVNHYIDGFERFPDSFYSPDMVLKLGVLYLAQLQQSIPDALDIAAEYFETFIQDFSDSPNAEMANYYLGFCYYNGRRFTDSNRVFREFAQRYPNSEFTPEAMFYYSEGDYNQGNLESAIEGFDAMIARYPNNVKTAEALYTKAWCYLDLEQEQNAIDTFQQLVDDFPESEFSATALFSIADFFYNEQRYDEAIANYERVLDEYPESDVAVKVPETLNDIIETVAYLAYEEGLAYFAEAQSTSDPNMYRQAIEVFQVVVSEYPDTESEIGAYSNMGICYESLGQWQNAIDAYDEVLRLFESGADVSDDALLFATQHKNYIVANRL